MKMKPRRRRKKESIISLMDANTHKCANKNLLLSDEGDFFLLGQTTRGPTTGSGEERRRILIEVRGIFGLWPSGENADV